MGGNAYGAGRPAEGGGVGRKSEAPSASFRARKDGGRRFAFPPYEDLRVASDYQRAKATDGAAGRRVMNTVIEA